MSRGRRLVLGSVAFLAAASWAVGAGASSPSRARAAVPDRPAAAYERRPDAAPLAPNPLHPVFVPLDSTGSPARTTGRPVSTERTCGACHDVAEILAHSDHWTGSVHVDCIACHVAGGRLPDDASAYDAEGRLRRESLYLAAPRDEECAACHAIVEPGREPVRIPVGFGGSLENDGRTDALTLETGEILSGQNLSESFLNLCGKDGRAYPWDAHARRLVTCVDCHYARNNPLKAEVKRERPGFLVDDPRHVAFSAYLKHPDHRLASASCTSCHDPLEVHDFLPYKERHLDVLSCGACHMPQMFGPAARSVDSTVVTPGGAPAILFRGFTEDPGPLNAAYDTGYVPLLRQEHDATTGQEKLAPYNAVQTFAWRNRATGRALPWSVVKAAFLEEGVYSADIVSALDANGDRSLSATELRLDAPAKLDAVRKRLIALGVSDPEPSAAVRYFPIRHGVMSGDQVIRDCNTCHDKNGRFAAGLALSPYTPAGLDAPRTLPPPPSGRYLFGHARGGWSDRLGFSLFLLAIVGIAIHGGVRLRLARTSRRGRGPALERVYVYTTYERIWHWLMAASVLVLMATGLQIHFTGRSAPLPLPVAVSLHNAFALVLTINAFLSLFYHLTTLAIRRFFPPPEGMLERMLEQARFYTSGIFLGRPHPSPKTPERRLNPLQQVTYLVLLNLLFPFQVATGTLIWGASRWPHAAERLGGLVLLAPLHNLGAWLLVTFAVMHLYLTTTGHTAFSNLRAMVDGYDEVDPVLLRKEGSSRA